MKYLQITSIFLLLCISVIFGGCGNNASVQDPDVTSEADGTSQTDTEPVITNETLEYGYGTTVEMVLVNGKYTTGTVYQDGEEAGELTVEYTTADDNTEYVYKVNFVYTEGTGTILLNEKQDVISKIGYDADGNEISNVTCEYTYDSNGNKTKALVYNEGQLQEEQEYALGVDGACYLKRNVQHYSEDNYAVYEYNEHGDETLYSQYSDGVLRFEYRYEHTYDGNGALVRTLQYSGEELEVTYEYSYDNEKTYKTAVESNGEKTVWTEENGALTHAVSYDANGIIVKEEQYKIHSDEKHYDEKGKAISVSYKHCTISYKDGVKASELVYVYDDDMNVIGKKEYDQNGTLCADYKTEYEFFDNGYIKKQSEYLNGRLLSEKEYEMEGNHRKLLRDTEYDENGGIIKESIYTTYREGNIVLSRVIKSTRVENGEKTITENDETGRRSAYQKYDASGTLVMDQKYEYELYEDGGTKIQKTYNFGKLSSVTEYLEESEDGVLYIITQYDEDGTPRFVSEYSPRGDGTNYTSKQTWFYGKGHYEVTEFYKVKGMVPKHSQCFDESGNLVGETEYTLKDDGTSYESKSMSISQRTYYLYGFDENGNMIRTEEKKKVKNIKEYDENGNVLKKYYYEEGESGEFYLSEYEYLIDGKQKTECYSENGELIQIRYTYTVDDKIKTEYYGADGTLSNIQYRYKVDGEWINELYDENGKLISKD